MEGEAVTAVSSGQSTCTVMRYGAGAATGSWLMDTAATYTPLLRYHLRPLTPHPFPITSSGSRHDWQLLAVTATDSTGHTPTLVTLSPSQIASVL